MSDVRIPDLNQITIAGRLVRDPEIRTLSSGTQVAGCAVAHDRFYRSNGESQKATTFIDIKAWEKTAEILSELAKGAEVVITGRIEQESWDDKQTGQKRSKHVIVCDRVHPLAWKRDGNDQQGAAPRQQSRPAPAPQPQQAKLLSASPDDDIPF